MATIPSNFNLPTSKQVPDHAILDYYNKQAYLGNAYSFPIGAETLSSTSETLIALIQNPSTISSKPNLVSLFNNLRTTASDNDGSDGTTFFRYYINPAVSTTGTPTVPVNCRTGSVNTSVALCFVNGQFTLSANGTLWRATTAGYSAINDSDLLLILDPGSALLVTATAVSSGSVITQATSWYEL
jgi:hypothetical protein